MPTTKADIITASGRSVDEIRANIRICMRNMVNNALEIGTDLLEMKEACRHGEWLPFLKELGLSASTAANYMRIASEVTTGSKLSRLPYTKILAVLAAPPEDREELTEAAESLSAAEIRKITEEKNREVQRMREERDRAAEAANTETARADQAEEALRKSEADAKGIYDRNASLLTEMQNLQVKLEKAREGQKQAEAGCNILKGSVEKQKEIINDLQEKLIVAENQQKIEVVPADYEQLKRERQELIDAAAEAEARAAEAEAALETAQTDGNSNQMDKPIGIILGQAMNAFFSECEMMPFNPAALQRDSYAVRHCIGQIHEWCLRMEDALAAPVITEASVI